MIEREPGRRRGGGRAIPRRRAAWRPPRPRRPPSRWPPRGGRARSIRPRTRCARRSPRPPRAAPRPPPRGAPRRARSRKRRRRPRAAGAAPSTSSPGGAGAPTRSTPTHDQDHPGAPRSASARALDAPVGPTQTARPPSPGQGSGTPTMANTNARAATAAHASGRRRRRRAPNEAAAISATASATTSPRARAASQRPRSRGAAEATRSAALLVATGSPPTGVRRHRHADLALGGHERVPPGALGNEPRIEPRAVPDGVRERVVPASTRPSGRATTAPFGSRSSHPPSKASRGQAHATPTRHGAMLVPGAGGPGAAQATTAATNAGKLSWAGQSPSPTPKPTTTWRPVVVVRAHANVSAPAESSGVVPARSRSGTARVSAQGARVQVLHQRVRADPQRGQRRRTRLGRGHAVGHRAQPERRRGRDALDLAGDDDQVEGGGRLGVGDGLRGEHVEAANGGQRAQQRGLERTDDRDAHRSRAQHEDDAVVDREPVAARTAHLHLTGTRQIERDLEGSAPVGTEGHVGAAPWEEGVATEGTVRGDDPHDFVGRRPTVATRPVTDHWSARSPRRAAATSPTPTLTNASPNTTTSRPPRDGALPRSSAQRRPRRRRAVRVGEHDDAHVVLRIDDRPDARRGPSPVRRAVARHEAVERGGERRTGPPPGGDDARGRPGTHHGHPLAPCLATPARRDGRARRGEATRLEVDRVHRRRRVDDDHPMDGAAGGAEHGLREREDGRSDRQHLKPEARVAPREATALRRRRRRRRHAAPHEQARHRQVAATARVQEEHERQQHGQQRQPQGLRERHVISP